MRINMSNYTKCEGFCDYQLSEEEPFRLFERSVIDYTYHGEKTICRECDGEKWYKTVPDDVKYFKDGRKVEYDKLDYKVSGSNDNVFVAGSAHVGQVKRVYVDIPPFVSLELNFFADEQNYIKNIHEYSLMGSANTKMKANPRFGFCSENGYVNMFENLCDVYGIRTTRWSGCIDSKFQPDLSLIRLIYPAVGYGYNNTLFVVFSVEDLLNMNPGWYKDKTEYSLFQRLKNACERMPELKKTINFNVFERPLTNNEKLGCASSLLRLSADYSRKGKTIKKNL